MIKVIQADVTTLAVDAIVNAAGEELFNACLKVREVRPGVRRPTGEVLITANFRLPYNCLPRALMSRRVIKADKSWKVALV